MPPLGDVRFLQSNMKSRMPNRSTYPHSLNIWGFSVVVARPLEECGGAGASPVLSCSCSISSRFIAPYASLSLRQTVNLVRITNP